MSKRKTDKEQDEELLESINSVMEGGEPTKPTEDQPAAPVEPTETSGEKPEEEKEEVVADTDDPDFVKPSEEEPTPTAKIKVGDKEYDADELDNLVRKGLVAKQVEEEQNIDISKLQPEFTKRSQLLKNPEALREYVKDLGYDLVKPEVPMTEEEKAAKEAVTQARLKYGFLTKEDIPELIGTVFNKLREDQEKAIQAKAEESRAVLQKTVESVSKAQKVDSNELANFMYFRIQTTGVRPKEMTPEVVEGYAKELRLYKGAVSKPATPAPQKPDVLKTENKGSGGVRPLPKEKPIPHPDKDPEAYAARILEFLTPKSPEEA